LGCSFLRDVRNQALARYRAHRQVASRVLGIDAEAFVMASITYSRMTPI